MYEEQREAAQRSGFEDFVGGRLLAWVGSGVVLLGMVLLVAVAIGRGWIDEPTRIGIAFGGSAAMLAVGVWLYERRGSTQASMLLAGTGLAALFLTVAGGVPPALFVTCAAGIQLYPLYPAPMALLEAALIGTVGMVLALRWDSRPIAGLSI